MSLFLTALSEQKIGTKAPPLCLAVSAQAAQTRLSRIVFPIPRFPRQRTLGVFPTSDTASKEKDSILVKPWNLVINDVRSQSSASLPIDLESSVLNWFL